MDARARIAGVRLGLTYGAGLIVLGLTIAALTSKDVLPAVNAKPVEMTARQLR